MEKQVINPEWALDSRPRGYSHVIRVDNPKAIIHLAGQAALDDKLNVVGVGDIEIQTRKTFENIKRHLEGCGSSLKDVVKMIIYVTDIEAMQWPVRKVRSEFFDFDNPPASTMVEISKLAVTGMLIEVDIVAVQ